MIKDWGLVPRWGGGGAKRANSSAGKLPHNQRNQIINIKSFTFSLS